MGKRFICDKCGSQVLVTKAGDGAVGCCDQEMTPVEPRPMPSSD